MTVTDAQYWAMVIQFFLPRLDDIDTNDMYFQQNVAICRISREANQLLHETFTSRVLSRFVDQNRSLTPLDFSS